MRNNPVEKAVKILGSQRKLAAIFGVKQQAVKYWINHGLPAKHVLKLEAAVCGAVSRHELRPDIYPPEDYRLRREH